MINTQDVTRWAIQRMFREHVGLNDAIEMGWFDNLIIDCLLGEHKIGY